MTSEAANHASVLESALGRLAEDGIKIAHVGIYDLFGTFRERRLPISDVARISDGEGTFVNVLPRWTASEGVFGEGAFVGEQVRVDPESIRPYPFEPSACMLIADYVGESAALSSRTLLQRQIDRASSLGYRVEAGFESEFIVLEEDQSSLRDGEFHNPRAFAEDNRCWSGDSAATHAEFIQDLESALVAGEVPIQSLSLELGPGCFEITLRHRDPMRAAEDMLAAKLIIRARCRQLGKTASFMAQLGAEYPGLSQHPHLSLVDAKTGENLFGSGTEGGPNKLTGQFMAGMLEMMPVGMALTHHNVNAYRRHAPGNWAPKSATWAEQNYAAAIRAVLSPSAHARLEYRLPGSDANPFLNLAFMLGSGLTGIEKELPLPAPMAGGGPDEIVDTEHALPHDLTCAIAAMRGSAEAKSVWGEVFIRHFCQALEQEDVALRREVSLAERARYLEVL